MKTMHVGTLAFVYAFALAALPAQANLVSTFDSGNEGWSAVDPTADYTSVWQSSGGNPGGYLLGTESSPLGNTGYFIAPAAWLGDLSIYAGGTLSYDLRVVSGTAYFADADIQICSGATCASWTGPNPVGNGWVTFSTTLVPANFSGGNLAAILSNVTQLRLRGEFITGIEQEAFDNVRLTAAIPEPESYAMLLAGLGLLGWITKRRRAS